MVDLVKMEELRNFLDGSGTLEGVSFGETPTTQTANFWWRKHLTAIDEAKAEIERLREALKPFAQVWEGWTPGSFPEDGGGWQIMFEPYHPSHGIKGDCGPQDLARAARALGEKE